MKSQLIKQWWPLGQSLDLVKGDIQEVSAALSSEIARCVESDTTEDTWMRFDSLDQVFGSVSIYTNVPTQFFAIATESEWVVLWNNSYMCDGYYALCYNLTANYDFMTVHWSAHDDLTTFQAGTSFTACRKENGKVKERSVYCAQEDGQWIFQAAGEPLEAEDLSWYEARQKKSRLNETIMQELLKRLGARPWQDNFYDFRRDVFRVVRQKYPDTIVTKDRADILNSEDI